MAIKLFERMYGDFAPDAASPSRVRVELVSGVTLFVSSMQEYLSLDSTTAQVLGWTGTRGGVITLRHLLSFTSGLNPENSCTYQAGITLADCVDRNRPERSARSAWHPRHGYGSTLASRPAWRRWWWAPIGMTSTSSNSVGRCSSRRSCRSTRSRNSNRHPLPQGLAGHVYRAEGRAGRGPGQRRR